MTQLLVTEHGCEQTVAWLARTLATTSLRVASSYTLGSCGCLQPAELGGLRAVPSFDLRAALAQSWSCPCPHHRSAACACQMAVVLVHDPGGAWAALVAHSHGARTWVDLVQATTRFPHTALSSAIRQSITALPA